MGWANWNRYFCDYDDSTIRAQADTLVRTGMRDLGYRYVIIQECIAPSRDANGALVPDSRRFPQGIKTLADYLHSLGLKAGIYTDVGAQTCFEHPQYEGSFNHEDQDAATFASWGIDLVEEDYCNLPRGHTGKELYERMAVAIRKTGRAMLFYICSWGNERPWEWAQGSAQLWRTDADISWEKNHVQWDRVVKNFESNARHAVFSAPDSWNDPDMLEVGNPGLNATEARSHFSMWAISAAPLWAGTDLTRMDAESLAIFTNPEIIAVDQDPLGAGPTKIREDSNGLQVWSKQLGTIAGGSHAVMLLNETAAQAEIKVWWTDLGLLPNAHVRDLWERRDLGSFADFFSALVQSHGVVVLKVTGDKDWQKPVVYEAEWPGNLRLGETSLITCNQCSAGFAVAIGGSLGSGSTLIFRHVNVPRAGRYHIHLYFLGKMTEKGNLQIEANGTHPIAVNVGSLAASPTEITVRLRSGDNDVSVRPSPGLNFDLDRIEVMPQ
jgi:alpha-galactosidase